MRKTIAIAGMISAVLLSGCGSATNIAEVATTDETTAIEETVKSVESEDEQSINVETDNTESESDVTEKEAADIVRSDILINYENGADPKLVYCKCESYQVDEQGNSTFISTDEYNYLGCYMIFDEYRTGTYDFSYDDNVLSVTVTGNEYTVAVREYTFDENGVLEKEIYSDESEPSDIEDVYDKDLGLAKKSIIHYYSDAGEETLYDREYELHPVEDGGVEVIYEFGKTIYYFDEYKRICKTVATLEGSVDNSYTETVYTYTWNPGEKPDPEKINESENAGKAGALSDEAIIKACKEYTGAPIVEIDHYDEETGWPVVWCYEDVDDHTSTWAWIKVDPETGYAEDDVLMEPVVLKYD
ncbi:MAG: hypothetical protein K5886_00955 [Lachnospiraceae bacterium]|nr:hypothetical protein [Lachnospiraceae bacterium]